MRAISVDANDAAFDLKGSLIQFYYPEVAASVAEAVVRDA